MPVCEKCWVTAGLMSAVSNRIQYECYLELLAMYHKHNDDIICTCYKNPLLDYGSRTKEEDCPKHGGGQP